MQTYLSFKNNLFPQVQQSADKYLQITRNCPSSKKQKKQEGPKGPSRLPEEKVKGHSGAIYKGPLMLSTNNW